ncbi:DoxX family protein [Sansalvadorimonas verongulae]|uniref:DoxX family protein n=1 Tax=Sansalvadorimonas verongulae TaxID=2172824 RepID=UPI0012BBA929|nr:DoxX family protein [Sansalvadorimonas verongulae]MTI12926.1 DoxX family protein [Sansalvadorimonas verongulae]
MKEFMAKVTGTQAGWAALALRIPVGIIFMAHGAQKLFGWFGGYGLTATGQWMASIGIEPGVLMAFLAGSAEFFGGLFLILGFLTRPSSIALAITMVVAISLHFEHGLFLSNNGYEFGLSLLAASLSLVLSGGGALSVDQIISRVLNEDTPQKRDVIHGKAA